MPPASPDPLLPVFFDALAAQPRQAITFVLIDDLGKYCGLADLDHGVVYLSSANTPGEMRATLAHELFHLLGTDSPECEVEAQAAELLVPLHEALAAQARGDLAGAADLLGVDTALVRARLRLRGVVDGEEKAS